MCNGGGCLVGKENATLDNVTCISPMLLIREDAIIADGKHLPPLGSHCVTPFAPKGRADQISRHKGPFYCVFAFANHLRYLLLEIHRFKYFLIFRTPKSSSPCLRERQSTQRKACDHRSSARLLFAMVWSMSAGT